MQYRILCYQTVAGKKPFVEWLEKLRRRDRTASAAVDARLERIRDVGNFGDFKALGGGVVELRLHGGPGYRLYYLQYGRQVVLMLLGGEKSDQRADIAKAYAYAKDYWRRI